SQRRKQCTDSPVSCPPTCCTRSREPGRPPRCAAPRSTRSPSTPPSAPSAPQRFIHDQRNGADMTPGPVVRAEGQPPVDDPAVNQAYDNFGDTHKFYWEILHRDSLDDQGMPIHGMVHFDT